MEVNMTGSVKIIPAILTEDPQTLETMLKQAETFTDYIQLDIMDGKFVPSRSITWDKMAAVKTRLNWEVHLMVEQPEKQLEHFRTAGAQKAIFHFEATAAPLTVISAARDRGLKVGLAVNPETPVSKIKSLTDKVDSVLFLAVHPGFYGAKFIPETLDKVRELRQARPDLIISIDGGIKENNIVPAAKSGVNEICVGSAIFLQPDLGEAYRKLVRLVN
jgi:ribulose-phosphate 3-epimerase